MRVGLCLRDSLFVPRTQIELRFLSERQVSVGSNDKNQGILNRSGNYRDNPGYPGGPAPEPCTGCNDEFRGYLDFCTLPSRTFPEKAGYGKCPSNIQNKRILDSDFDFSRTPCSSEWNVPTSSVYVTGCESAGRVVTGRFASAAYLSIWSDRAPALFPIGDSVLSRQMIGSPGDKCFSIYLEIT